MCKSMSPECWNESNCQCDHCYYHYNFCMFEQPIVALQINAQMENVTNLRADGEDFRWYMKVRLMLCNWD